MSIIEELLRVKVSMNEDELKIVMASIAKAREVSIDLYQFTNEVSNDLSYPANINIIAPLTNDLVADELVADDLVANKLVIFTMLLHTSMCLITW